MSTFEEDLRRSLGRQVAELPAVHDRAERAIRSARTIRRRRLVSGVLAAFVLVVGTAAAFGGPRESSSLPLPPATTPTAAPTPTLAADAPPLVDIVVRSALDTVRIWRAAERKEVDVYDRPATTVVRFGDGWLAIDDRWNLVLLQLGQKPIALSAGVRQVAVAPNSRSIAWRNDTMMAVGTVTPSGVLVTERSTAAPANPETGPVLYTGKVVLLSGAFNRGRDDEHDIWVPGDGDYVSTAKDNSHVVRIFGRRPDTGMLVGVTLNSDGKQCIAELEPAPGLRITRKSCDLDSYGYAGSLSPSGRRLALDINEPHFGPAHLTVVDLDALFTAPKPSVVAFGSTFYNFGWETEDSLIGGQDHAVCRLQPATGQVTELNVPGLSADPGVFVVR
ncbi:hypothetical protein Lfu02_21950 [Longispora fulva]|uniref:Uncharacterized protein n=1 Tax=Longispora fulva TaxID=619741 RepID=A0A8J7GMU2_9ACTN|nr:hypothetical protein [Longispora fulva]MBG6139793.1 hypothetical protein [Longispora fulva]GIG57823.1 hypothetical protein Lfu02_21950 [Longispora fulva]